MTFQPPSKITGLTSLHIKSKCQIEKKKKEVRNRSDTSEFVPEKENLWLDH